MYVVSLHTESTDSVIGKAVASGIVGAIEASVILRWSLHAVLSKINANMNHHAD